MEYFLDFAILIFLLVFISDRLGKIFYYKNKWKLSLFLLRLNIFSTSSENFNIIGNCYAELDKNNQAIKYYRKALFREPKNFIYYQNLGLSYLDLGLYNQAYENFKIAYKFKYIVDYVDEKKYTTIYKINHDIEQINFLIDKSFLDQEYCSQIREYENIRKDIINSEEFFYEMDNNDYDKNLYLYNEKELDHAINSKLDLKQIQSKYLNNKIDLISFDDFLENETIEELKNICLHSTIWHEYERKRGYIASYISNGFNYKIIYQIATELKEKFPDIFKDYNLRNAWAFKYMDKSEGVLIHADEAMINVNFWITDDSANKNQDGGGMIIFDTPAPNDWKFNQYNKNKDYIENYLVSNNSQKVKIAYKQNRVIIFNSALFHQTDDFDFKTGYINHRVNITLLFGKR